VDRRNLNTSDTLTVSGGNESSITSMIFSVRPIVWIGAGVGAYFLLKKKKKK
jgi:hypothetical protein